LTSSDADGFYFALLTDQNIIPKDDSLRRVRARKASPNDDLVVKRLLSAGDTIVSLDVPIDVASGWWAFASLARLVRAIRSRAGRVLISS
jgi:hypothetical protein